MIDVQCTHKHFNTRRTLDNNLRYTDFDYDLFSDNVNFKQAREKDKTILEVKYDRFLFAQIQDILSNCDFLGKPPSKYANQEIIKTILLLNKGIRYGRINKFKRQY